MTAAQYIQSKGFEYRQQSGQIILKTCPFCHDEKYHFYIDQQKENAPFFCHKCNHKGNIYTMQKHFGDKPSTDSGYNRSRTQQNGITAAFPDKRQQYVCPDEKKVLKAHETLLSDTTALEYVTNERGIDIETVKTFKIGLAVDQSKRRWLSIPHYAGGKLENIKSRSLPPAEKTFRRVKDCRSVLFNQDAIKGAEEIYLCEGELDALTLIGQRIKNTVATTTGAGNFDAEWIDQLEKVKKVYIAYDADEAGRKGAREVARRLGYERCFIINLPDGQDVNDYFKNHDVMDFQKLINASKRFDVAGVMNLGQGLEQLKEEINRPEKMAGIRTGWPSVDRLIKTGLCPGELCVLSAPPKIGKSSLALQLCTGNALENIPALFYSLEMRSMKVIEKIVKLHTETENISDIEIDRTSRELSGKPLYLGYAYQKPKLENIIETIKQAVKRYGLRLVVFDHLHFLCRSLTNQVQEVGLAVQAFKFLAEEMEIPVVLIAQPRKVNPNAIMTAQDLKDSSSIYSDCDHLILMHRKRKTNKDVGGLDTAFDPITVIRLEASRYNAGGETLLYFHGEYSRFDEINNR